MCNACICCCIAFGYSAWRVSCHCNLEHRSQFNVSHGDMLLCTNPETTQLATGLGAEGQANKSDTAVCAATGTE